MVELAGRKRGILSPGMRCEMALELFCPEGRREGMNGVLWERRGQALGFAGVTVSAQS